MTARSQQTALTAQTSALTLVVDAVSQGDVEAVVASALGPHLVHVTRSREEVVPILVEGHGHDSVRQVKGLLDAVSVVNVDVDVQNSGVVPATHTHTHT